MFFKQLFEKARLRQAHAPAPDPAQLIETARNAPEATARREACRLIVQLDVLRSIAAEDPDPGVRDLAGARFRKLLCGQDDQSPPAAERSAAFATCDDPTLISQVALRAAEPELRRTAIERLTDPRQLLICAAEDALASNRKAAADRIHDREVLEQLARLVSKRDKGVYKLAKERLKALHEANARPRRLRAQADAIIDRLERLGRFDNWTQDQALLQLLDREWTEVEASLGADLDATRRERRESLRKDFIDAYEAYARDHESQLAEERARSAAAERRRELIDALQTSAELGDRDALAARIDAIEQDWTATESAGAGESIRRAYANALAHAHRRLSQLDAEREHGLATEALRKDAQKALADGELDQRRVNALKQRLDKLGGREGLPESAVTAVDAVASRFRKHREQVRRKLQALPKRLGELDAHFAAGQLKQAEPLYQSIRATLEHAKSAGLPADERADAEQHLREIEPQLRELQRWRRWGADTRRQSLCEEIERLAADTDHDLEPLANRLAELADDWRALDRNGAPAEDALRQRFRAAADVIHERCKPFHEAQAKIRSANREQRQALCEQLETFLDQVDWDRMDWKKAMRAAREMRNAWSALDANAPMDVRHRRGQRPLEGRFRKSLHKLDDALNAERERNLAERRELIEEMRKLAEEPDLRRATDGAKALQRRWQPTVTGRQRDENALWKEFRAAADAIFARREEQYQARNAELEDNLATRQALCAELAAAAEQVAEADALRKALRELDQRWRDTESLPVPKAKVASLGKRWEENHDAAEAKLTQLEARGVWSGLSALAQQARWCEDSARRLFDETADEAPEAQGLRTEWQTLTASAQASAKLTQAAELVFATAAGDAEARAALRQRMREAASERGRLCLRLEVATGVESPAELEAQRMALQVERLKERMGAGADETDTDDALALLRAWYELAPAEPTPGLDLQGRLQRIEQALAAGHGERSEGR